LSELPVVHLLCPTHNGAAFLPTFLASVQRQTHTAWTLWVLDDHSSDHSADIVHDAAQDDPRVRVLPRTPQRLGAVGAFAHLWAQLPADAAYIGFADQDDVWYPEKLAVTLEALQRAEAGTTRPVLVHTDLQVVGPQLEPIAPSYWAHAGIHPEPATLRRLATQNVVTGCTMLLNRALYDAVGPIPAGATMHDAWVACAAAAMGEIIALPHPTVQYRQHDTNTLGARQAVDTRPLLHMLPRLWNALTDHGTVRRQIAATATQAALLLRQYGAQLGDADGAFLRAYAQIPTMSWWRRKRAVAQMHLHGEHGWLRNAGIVWRA
jgi:hypothetical protein